jgi:hypothetical protein
MEELKSTYKKIQKGSILADAKKSLAEHRGTNAWLRKATGFNHNLRLSDDKALIADKLFNELMKGRRIYKREQKRLDFEILCANLLYQRGRRPVAISFNRNDWTPSRYRRAGYFTVEGAIDISLRNELIKIKKGFGHENPKLAHRTKIWPTRKFLTAFIPLSTKDCIVDPVELLILRNIYGIDIDYRDTKETRRVRRILIKVNSITDRALIRYVDPDSHVAHRVQSRLHCVYNIDFKHGGRFYTSERDGYQSLSGEERTSIHIDGLPTIELDFSGLHPRLLYALEGIQYDDDPYTAVLDDPRLRSVIKHLFLVVLNSDSEKMSVSAGNKFLYDNMKYYHRLKRRGITVRDHLLPMIKAGHPPISKYFFSGTGLNVMNTDSKIALDVIEKFVNDGTPILSIHDSFIVQQQHEDRLRETMSQAYKKRTNGFTCPVK